MPRRLKLTTAEMGYLELFLIYQTGPDFEATWKPLQGLGLAACFTVVTKETMDHALHGFTRPFIQQLGLAPAGCLRKIPVENRECAHLKECPFYDRVGCLPTAKKLPNCYQPAGVGDETRQLGAEVVSLWREGVFIVVVTEPK